MDGVSDERCLLAAGEAVPVPRKKGRIVRYRLRTMKDGVLVALANNISTMQCPKEQSRISFYRNSCICSMLNVGRPKGRRRINIVIFLASIFFPPAKSTPSVIKTTVIPVLKREQLGIRLSFCPLACCG
eukprot:scaffold36536_cov229-Amphora_coffeaeformis.AAC.4